MHAVQASSSPQAQQPSQPDKKRGHVSDQIQKLALVQMEMLCVCLVRHKKPGHEFDQIQKLALSQMEMRGRVCPHAGKFFSGHGQNQKLASHQAKIEEEVWLGCVWAAAKSLI